MPAKYHTVSPMIWDRTFRRLTKNAKLVAFYAWTALARSSEGLSRIPITYIVGDTAIPEDEVLSALEELQTAGIIDYDEATETIFDRSLRWNPIKSGVNQDGEAVPDNRQKGALRQIDSLIDSPLLPAFVRFASEFSPDLADAIIEKYPLVVEALASPSEAPPKGGVEKRRLREEQRRAVVEKSSSSSQSRGSVSGSDSEEPFKKSAPPMQNGSGQWTLSKETLGKCIVCGVDASSRNPEGVVQCFDCSGEGGF